METVHDIEFVEDLDFNFDIPCDHETCDLEADYLLILHCPACTYEERFFICDPHWIKVSQSHIKATCSRCVVYGELEDFLVDRRPLR